MSVTGTVDQLGFGGASVGNLHRASTDAEARELLDAAWDAGIRLFDTAPHYGLGLSERRIGDFLADRPRDEVVVSTKVGRLLAPNPDPSPGLDDEGFDVPADRVRVFDPSEAGIRASLESSLGRLRLEHVDVLYLHDPDVYDLDRGLVLGLPALARVREEGLASRIGIGTNSVEAAVRAVREGDLDEVMIASRYTLLEQPAAAELLPLCVERGVAVVVASVYNTGLLANPRPTADARYGYGAIPPELLSRVARLVEVCGSFGLELPVAALQYPLRHPAVRAIVVGAASPAQLLESVRRLETPVPEELWAALATDGLAP
jgi:D-threo-aldose 1-dehydrogenase